MLCLLLNLCGAIFAVRAERVVRVVPRIPLRPIPQAPAYFAGLFDYRGKAVPVIDLCALTANQPSMPLLSSRIILIKYGKGEVELKVLGLLAEQVMEVKKIPRENFSPAGVTLESTPYLGQVAQTDRGMIQLIEVEELLPPQVRSQLFQEGVIAA